MSWAKRCLNLVGALVATLAPATIAATPEARCVELGADCVCSEPLNFSGAVPVSVPFDPPDSTTFECNNGPSVLAENGATMVAGGVAGFPAGIDWVLAFSPAGDPTQQVSHSGESFTDATVCARHYFRFSADLPAPDTSDKRIKMARFEKGAGSVEATVVMSTGFPNPSFTYATNNGDWHPVTFHKLTSPTSVRMDDCRTSVCRMEVCFDHHQGVLVYRGLVYVVGTGATMNFEPDISPMGIAPAYTGDTTWITDSFFQQIGTVGAKYVSHAMMAKVSPADSGFWIGAADEIENPKPQDPPPIDPPSGPPPEQPLEPIPAP